MADRLPRRELIAKLKIYEGGLARGRRMGADIQKLAAIMRQRLIDQAVSNLLRNRESAFWRADAIINFVFQRQLAIGLRKPYSFLTLGRRVRKAISKARATLSQSST